MDYSNTVNVRYSEMDFDLVLKPSALLQFLQDSASENAEKLGFGYSFISKNNLGWYLLKYRIEFEDYPKGVYNLRIETEPRGYNKLFAFRDFAFYEGEKLLGKAATTWSLVDIDTKNIAPVQEVLNGNPYMTRFEKREGDLSYEKIKPFQRVDYREEFKIRFEDLDVNKHANNVNYVIWAFEPLGMDFRSGHKLKTLDIVFKKEIKYGEIVVSEAEIEGLKTNHVLKSKETGEDLCLISANWVQKR